MAGVFIPADELDIDPFDHPDPIRKLVYETEQFVVYPDPGNSQWIYYCGGGCNESYAYDNEDQAVRDMLKDVAEVTRASWGSSMGGNTADANLYGVSYSTTRRDGYACIADISDEDGEGEAWIAAWRFGDESDFTVCGSREGAEEAARSEMNSWAESLASSGELIDGIICDAWQREAALADVARLERELGDLIRQADDQGIIGHRGGCEITSTAVAGFLGISRETVDQIRKGNAWVAAPDGEGRS